MNICVISGELQNNAIVRGKKTKALVFTVVTKQPASNGQSDGDADSLASFVPCVVFNPSPELEAALTQGKGMRIELQGRVSVSRNEAADEPRSNAEVVVYTKTVRTWR
jgi:single-stranded DNA-binding protein